MTGSGRFRDARGRSCTSRWAASRCCCAASTWWQALSLAGTALRSTASSCRASAARASIAPGRCTRAALRGILLYPLAVLLLILRLPPPPRHRRGGVGHPRGRRRHGDLVGTRDRRPRMPWNPDKTLAGSARVRRRRRRRGRVARLVVPAGGRAAAVAVVHARRRRSSRRSSPRCVETIPIRLDDNLSRAGDGRRQCCGSLSLMSDGRCCAQRAAATLARTAASALAAERGRWRRPATRAHGLDVRARSAARHRHQRSSRRRLAGMDAAARDLRRRVGRVARRACGARRCSASRRSAADGAAPGNAIANTGVAAVAAVLSRSTTYAPNRRALAFVAALAAGGSDTIASEIGKAFGRHTVSGAHRSSAVPPGTPGAMSLEGTAAGSRRRARRSARSASRSASCRVDASPDRRSARRPDRFVESGLGATLEAPGILNNDVLNFINTAAAASRPSIAGDGCCERSAGAAACEFVAAVHARRAGARLRLRRRDRGRRAPREAWSPHSIALPADRPD